MTDTTPADYPTSITLDELAAAFTTLGIPTPLDSIRNVEITRDGIAVTTARFPDAEVRDDRRLVVTTTIGIDRDTPRQGPLLDHIVVFIDAAGEHRWRAVAGNGRVVAGSGEGYHNYFDCLDIARRLFPGQIIRTDLTIRHTSTEEVAP